MIRSSHSARRYKADARIEGVLVQKMAPRGHELVIGMVNDPTFGPIMMVGLGGTMVELMGDVVHRPAPVDVAEATDMLRGLNPRRLLAGIPWRAIRSTSHPLPTLIANLSRRRWRIASGSLRWNSIR